MARLTSQTNYTATMLDKTTLNTTPGFLKDCVTDWELEFELFQHS